MRAFCLLGAVGLVAVSHAEMVWYGGDFDGENCYWSGYGPDQVNFEGMLYDDFVWNSSSTAASICGTYFGDGDDPLKWEIRQGVTPTYRGDLVATGVSQASFSWLGNQWDIDYYRFEANIDETTLVNGGSYWLGVAALTDSENDVSGIGTTSGWNGVGSPLNDGNMMVFVDTYNNFIVPGYSASLGIASHAVPEPATLAALGFGLIACMRRRRL